MNNTKEICYVSFVKTVGSVYDREKIHKEKGAGDHALVESHSSIKTLESLESRNKNVEEEEVSGKFNNLLNQYARYVYFSFWSLYQKFIYIYI